MAAIIPDGAVTVRLSARMPWWFRAAMKAVTLWAWFGLPVNVDLVASWFADRIRFEAVEA